MKCEHDDCFTCPYDDCIKGQGSIVKTKKKPYAQWSEEAKQRARENMKRYYYSHLGERKAYSKKYYQEHKEEYKAKYLKNKEAKREACKNIQ